MFHVSGFYFWVLLFFFLSILVLIWDRAVPAWAIEWVWSNFSSIIVSAPFSLTFVRLSYSASSNFISMHFVHWLCFSVLLVHLLFAWVFILADWFGSDIRLLSVCGECFQMKYCSIYPVTILATLSWILFWLLASKYVLIKPTSMHVWSSICSVYLLVSITLPFFYSTSCFAY